MEFRKVKQCLQESRDTTVDEDTYEAARETCLVLGGKLGSIRNQQNRCYADCQELELRVDKELLACVEESQLADIDLREALKVEKYGIFHTKVKNFHGEWKFPSYFSTLTVPP